MSDEANFTPEYITPNGVAPLNFWCQKVLPLVYDDSLSYYEVLDKIAYYINGLLADVEELTARVEALEQAGDGNG